MSSDSRTAEREEERRLNMRTLAIASAASAAAALLVSQLWIAGTWLAAALTPVIISLVSEMLNRPTERIAKSFTSDRGPLAAAGRAGAGEARPPRDLGGEAPIRVYRAGEATPRKGRRLEPRQASSARGYGAGVGGREGRAGGAAGGGRGGGAPGMGAGAPDRGPGPREPVLGAPGMPPAGRGPATRRRKIAFGAVFGTAAIAFVIAVGALTLPELVAGESVGRNDGRTTLFGGNRSDNGGNREQAPQNTTEEEQPPPEEQQEQQQTTPEEETTPAPQEEPAPTQETTPLEAPAPGEPAPQTAPAPPTTQP